MSFTLSDETKRTWWFILPKGKDDRDILGNMVFDLKSLNEIFAASEEDLYANPRELANIHSKVQEMQWNNPADKTYFHPFKNTVRNYNDYNTLEIFTYNPSERFVADCVRCAFWDIEERRNSPSMFMVVGSAVARYLVEGMELCSSPTSSDTLDFSQDFTWAVQLVKIHVAESPPIIETDWRALPQSVKQCWRPTGQRAAFPQATAVIDCKQTLAAHGICNLRLMTQRGWPHKQREIYIAFSEETYKKDPKENPKKNPKEDISDVEMVDGNCGAGDS
ncbi:hypothetical protein QBC38DRAFT_486672 [Podospora fimiseda]|uniref:Uncharacterized protein n=1 Tax=Podospora fimiseda TaxID=252190 RepID=A0AAN7BII6_9PEZI|nr:hypothetical protein QBC38DRAFT_486672 [Podospora fimiseda]